MQVVLLNLRYSNLTILLKTLLLNTCFRTFYGDKTY